MCLQKSKKCTRIDHISSWKSTRAKSARLAISHRDAFKQVSYICTSTWRPLECLQTDRQTAASRGLQMRPERRSREPGGRVRSGVSLAESHSEAGVADTNSCFLFFSRLSCILDGLAARTSTGQPRTAAGRW
jgi:hypothetical protein